MTKNNLETKFVSDDGYDLCVSGNLKTEYKTEIPIDQRIGYIEGAGQLCRQCNTKNISC